jgi:glycosyltransferase involved in cell wall biosynthesis
MANDTLPMPESRPVNVVLTIGSLDRRGGGMQHAVAALADALVEVGCTTSLVSLASPQDATLLRPARATMLQAPVMRLRGHALWSAALSATITRRLARHSPALVHDNGLWGYLNWAAARAAARARVPLVLSPHGMLAPWALGFKPVRKKVALALYQRALLEQVRLFIVSSTAEASQVRAAGLRQPIAIVPAGVELPASVARPARAGDERHALFLSRVHPIKGLVPFIEAWHALQPQGWRVTVAGPDEAGHRAELEQLLERLGLADRFTFTGEADATRKAELFRSADLFVLPTYTENFGIVVAEALSYGVPVLTTRGAPWAVLEEIGAGWWVPPGVEGLVAGLRASLAASDEQRQRMGEAGRRYVELTLSWPGTARRTVEAYEWLLGLRAVRPGHVQLD